MAVVAQRCACSMSLCARRTHGTHCTTALLVLLATSLLGSAAPYPLPVPGDATAMEKRWENLFSRSYLGLTGDKSQLNWQSDYLLGIKRVRRLYCNVGIGFHLQVQPDGRISGTHQENQDSLIEISTVERGVISMCGVRSQLFVAMNSRGRLYGTRAFRDECKFKETLLPNNYNAYESSVYKGFYIALSKHGRAKRGNKATTASTVTHFLPRL